MWGCGQRWEKIREGMARGDMGLAPGDRGVSRGDVDISRGLGDWPGVCLEEAGGVGREESC